jgi:hypothetical protein
MVTPKTNEAWSHQRLLLVFGVTRPYYSLVGPGLISLWCDQARITLWCDQALLVFGVTGLISLWCDQALLVFHQRLIRPGHTKE